MVCKRKTCNAKGKVCGSMFVLESIHNHPNDQEMIEEMKFKSELKARALNSSQNSRQVFDSVSAQHPQTAANITFIEVSRSMDTSRRRANPTLPSNVEDFCQKIFETDQFHFFRECIKLNDIAIGALFFANLENFLGNVSVVAFDGTFAVVPKPFKQLFTIFCYIGTKFIPVFYCFMISKQKSHYIEFLKAIKTKFPNFLPIECMSDFETASRKAFSEQFPGIKVTGCFFHFKQCLVRKIGDFGLKTLLLSNQNFKNWFKLLCSIAILPEISFRQMFSCLKNFPIISSPTFTNKISRLIQYIERNWYGSIRNINLYEASHTTNNGAESYHSSLTTLLQRKRNVWVFLKIFNEYLVTVDIEAQRIGNHLITTRQRPSSIQANFRQNINEFDSGVIDKFQLIERSFNFVILPAIRAYINQYYRSTDTNLLETDSQDSLPEIAENETMINVNDEEYEGILGLNEFENEMPENIFIDDDIHTNDIIVSENQRLFEAINTLEVTNSAPRRECFACTENAAGQVLFNCGHSNMCFECIKSNLEFLINSRSNQIFSCGHCRTRIRNFAAIL